LKKRLSLFRGPQTKTYWVFESLLVFDFQLEFLMTTDLEPVCRWQKISSEGISAIQDKVLTNENHFFWNLTERDSDRDENISFSQ